MCTRACFAYAFLLRRLFGVSFPHPPPYHTHAFVCMVMFTVASGHHAPMPCRVSSWKISRRYSSLCGRRNTSASSPASSRGVSSSTSHSSLAMSSRIPRCRLAFRDAIHMYHTCSHIWCSCLERLELTNWRVCFGVVAGSRHCY